MLILRISTTIHLRYRKGLRSKLSRWTYTSNSNLGVKKRQILKEIFFFISNFSRDFTPIEALKYKNHIGLETNWGDKQEKRKKG